MYDSFLVPVDGSDPSRVAAAEAIGLARRFDAGLTLLSVIEPTLPSLTTSVTEDPDRNALDDRTAAALDRVESRASAADVACECRVERGHPHEVIASDGADRDTDLIVMGTHGRTGLAHTVLGSVTERILRTSDVPVLTAHLSDEPGSVETVLVPTDGSDCAARAADHAFAIAEAFDASVRLLTVVDTKTLASAYGSDESVPEFVDALTAECLRALTPLRERALDRGLDCETAVIEGRPDHVIPDDADDADADYVVMGTHGRGGVERFLLGSVTERTLRTSSVPVVAVPGGDTS